MCCATRPRRSSILSTPARTGVSRTLVNAGRRRGRRRPALAPSPIARAPRQRPRRRGDLAPRLCRPRNPAVRPRLVAPLPRSTSVSITGRGSIPGRSPTTRSRSKQMKTTRRSKRLETTRGRSKQRRTTRRRTSRTPLPNATPTPNAPPTPILARRRHRAERWSRGRGGRWRRRRRRPEDAHGDAYRRGCPRRRR